jgi:hypothetical protein
MQGDSGRAPLAVPIGYDLRWTWTQDSYMGSREESLPEIGVKHCPGMDRDHAGAFMVPECTQT